MAVKGSGYGFPISRKKKPKKGRISAWCIGLDLGYKETGILLRVMGEKRLRAWWVGGLTTKGTQVDAIRVANLSSAIIYQITTWIEMYDIEYLDICIETPFIRRKIAGSVYTKQVRLLQEVESEIFSFISPMLRECWVTEISPAESKILAAGLGVATKEEVYKAFPKFKRTPFPEGDTKYTISDAWAHSLAAWGKGGTRVRYDTETTVDVTEISKGTAK